MPSLDEFFAEAIEQADPTNMVEDEYKCVWAIKPVLCFKYISYLKFTPQTVRLLCAFLSRHFPRVVRNSNYGWRALRLLSRRSPHFFQPTNQKFKSLADYLDSMVSKLAKELPVSVGRGLFVCFFLLNVVSQIRFWINDPIFW